MRPFLPVLLPAFALLAACGSGQPPARPPAEHATEQGPVVPPPETDPLARPTDPAVPAPPPVVVPGEES